MTFAAGPLVLPVVLNHFAVHMALSCIACESTISHGMLDVIYHRNT